MAEVCQWPTPVRRQVDPVAFPQACGHLDMGGVVGAEPDHRREGAVIGRNPHVVPPAFAAHGGQWNRDGIRNDAGKNLHLGVHPRPQGEIRVPAIQRHHRRV